MILYGKKTSPAVIQHLDRGKKRFRITITEGKKRQVRHMTAAVGFPTLRLVRVALGPIHLDNLQPGEWRYLTADLLRALQILKVTPGLHKVTPKSVRTR